MIKQFIFYYITLLIGQFINQNEVDFDIESTTINFQDNYIEQQYAPVTDFRRKHKRDSKCNT